MTANNQDSDLQIRTDIELGADLEYLRGIPQFQRLIEEGYIKKTLLKDSMDMISLAPELRQNAHEQIMSVNYFRQYLARILQSAEKAKQDEAE